MSNQQRHAELDAIIAELDARANGASEFIDFEERCIRCQRMYAYHETRAWRGKIATVCPDGDGVFTLPEADEGI